MINSFGGDHGALYTLKTLDGKSAPNTNHGDHLRIFRPREGYLRRTNKEPLKVTQNLRFRRGERLKCSRSCFLIYFSCSPPFYFFAYCQHYYEMRYQCIRHILLDSAGGSGLIKEGVVEKERKKQVQITPS